VRYIATKKIHRVITLKAATYGAPFVFRCDEGTWSAVDESNGCGSKLCQRLELNLQLGDRFELTLRIHRWTRVSPKRANGALQI